MSKLSERVKAKQDSKKGCDFMDQRSKADFSDLEDMDITLEDAYRIDTKDEDTGKEYHFYAFIIKEYPENFFFSPTVLTDIIDEAAAIAEEDGEDLASVLDGEVVHVGKREPCKKKKGKSFFPCTMM